MQITLADRTIYYQIQYVKKSKMVLEISSDGMIMIKAPIKTPIEAIEEFLQKNKKEINRVYDRIENRKVITARKEYYAEETFLYMGKALQLVELFPDKTLPENKHDIEEILKKFYTSETKKIISKRVKHYEKIIGVKAKSVTIVESRGTWGTCSSDKELTFNYRLSMAPLESIDYVVIHELCHIFHMNHDRSFWRKVGSIDRNYKEHAKFLERYGVVMTV